MVVFSNPGYNLTIDVLFDVGAVSQCSPVLTKKSK